MSTISNAQRMAAALIGAGFPREEVEHTLSEQFPFEDAAALVEEAIARTGAPADPPSEPGGA